MSLVQPDSWIHEKGGAMPCLRLVSIERLSGSGDVVGVTCGFLSSTVGSQDYLISAKGTLTRTISPFRWCLVCQWYQVLQSSKQSMKGRIQGAMRNSRDMSRVMSEGRSNCLSNGPGKYMILQARIAMDFSDQSPPGVSPTIRAAWTWTR